MIITIDGPVASGKSTVARMLANKIGFFYLNTGSLYRAIAYAVLQQNKEIEGVTLKDIEDVIEEISYDFVGGKEYVYYHNNEITNQLDSPEISEAASRLSALPFVRTYADQLQRQLAQNKHCVIDGRDSGSVVFADAEHKFFIDAPDEVRAKRWQQKQAAKGINLTVLQSSNAIHQRDQRDRHRSVAPLMVPKGAVKLMNEGSNPMVVVDEMLPIVRRSI